MSAKRSTSPVHWIYTGAFALMATSGCSMLSSAGAIGPSEAEVKQAYDQGNQTYLSDVCAKASKRPQEGLFGLPTTKSEQQACTYARELQATNQSDALDSELARYQSELTCENALSSYTQFAEASQRSEDTVTAYNSAGLKLAECGDFATLVTGMLTDTDRHRGNLVAAISEVDPDLAAHFGEVSVDNTYSFDDSQYAAAAVTKWLIERSSYDNCTNYLKGMESSDIDTVALFVEFLGYAKCKPAGVKIASLLSSENDSLRFDACRALGRIGDPAHVKKLTVVSETDSAYTTNGLVKTYYVRDECRDAVGKIRLAE